MTACREPPFLDAACHVYGPSFEAIFFLKILYETRLPELSFEPRLDLISFHDGENEQV